ncbi:MAG: glycerophosphodiester phosphodiesterase family protein [Planctomycetia bacterium]|nr:glycerophosphodiester phosphodiesterase family protein [Planctomycetia bacterium]
MKLVNIFSLLLILLGHSLSLANDKEINKENQWPPVPETPVVAHRGFSFVAPENTLTAIREAIRCGAQGCEFDLYTTTDGKVFLFHDSNLKRTTGLDRPTKEIAWDELNQLDFGAWKGEQFKGEKAATLDEALKLLKGTNCRPVIEIKQDGFIDKVVDAVEENDLVETAVIIDFSSSRVKQVREANPNICVAWLCSFKEEQTTEEIAQIIIETLKKCDTNVVDMQYSKVSPELLKILQDAGIHVWCWTVDDPKDIQKLVEMGVESITTNRPNLVLDALKANEE